MMNRVLVALCLAFPMVALTGCESLNKALADLEKPSAKIKGVGFENLSLESLTLRFDVEVGNPYAFALPLAKMGYALNSGGKQFVAGDADVSGTVPAKGSRVIPLTAGIRFSDLLSVLRGIHPGSIVPYEAKLSLTARAPAVGDITLPMSHKGQVPVPTVPAVSVEGIRWDELSLSNTQATIRLRVKNTNDFAVGLDQLGYALSLGGSRIAGGGVSQSGRFGSGESRAMEIPISFSPASLGLGVFNMLRGKGADYALTGDMNLSTDFGPIRMPYDSRGQTSFTSK